MTGSSGLRLFLVNCSAFPGLPFPHLSIREDNRACLTRLGKDLRLHRVRNLGLNSEGHTGGFSEQRKSEQGVWTQGLALCFCYH